MLAVMKPRLSLSYVSVCMGWFIRPRLRRVEFNRNVCEHDCTYEDGVALT